LIIIIMYLEKSISYEGPHYASNIKMLNE
jgi:hypothetical protein